MQNAVHTVMNATEKPADRTATNALLTPIGCVIFRLDGTLFSIITMKLTRSRPCSKFEPDKEVLEFTRKTTMEYNYAHIPANMFSFNTWGTQYYV